jgi:hypothetical protein
MTVSFIAESSNVSFVFIFHFNKTDKRQNPSNKFEIFLLLFLEQWVPFCRSKILVPGTIILTNKGSLMDSSYCHQHNERISNLNF